MKKNSHFIYTAIIAVCFLYVGSAYMSQSLRLMEYYDERTVDIISSVYNYLLQAVGILIFSIGLKRRPELFAKRTLFVLLLASGAVFMMISQLSSSGPVISLSGYLLNLHIGLYFGYYLAFLAAYIPLRYAGLCFGLAYGFASAGTYFLSLIRDDAFLVSKEITVIYLLFAGITSVLVYVSNDIPIPGKAPTADHNLPLRSPKDGVFPYLVMVIVFATIISVTSSGLFYSLPVSSSVNWLLIRAFYAIGLILCGLLMDRNRLIGEICTIASLAYPLIFAALVNSGVTNTAALSLSYVFRGFITVYYVLSFTDLGAKSSDLLFLAPTGLLVSRATEGLLSFFLLDTSIPDVAQLVFSAACFVPLLILFVILQTKKYASPPLDAKKRLALFAEKHDLTAREMEILNCLCVGMSDAEIAEKCYISKNTVRFHVSNLLKKTGASSRTEVVRLLDLL